MGMVALLGINIRTDLAYIFGLKRRKSDGRRQKWLFQSYAKATDAEQSSKCTDNSIDQSGYGFKGYTTSFEEIQKEILRQLDLHKVSINYYNATWWCLGFRHHSIDRDSAKRLQHCWVPNEKNFYNGTALSITEHTHHHFRNYSQGAMALAVLFCKRWLHHVCKALFQMFGAKGRQSVFSHGDSTDSMDWKKNRWRFIEGTQTRTLSPFYLKLAKYGNGLEQITTASPMNYEVMLLSKAGIWQIDSPKVSMLDSASPPKQKSEDIFDDMISVRMVW